MPRRRLPYRTGDWFAVPLSGGGWASGLIARMDSRGIVLGYFFGPRHDSPPPLDDVRELRAEDAIAVAMLGDLGLVEGTWTIIGHQPNWHPADWTVPDFGRIDVFGEKAWRVRYHDPSLRWLADEAVEINVARMLPPDGLAGSGAIETRIARLLPQPPRRAAGSSASDTVGMSPLGGPKPHADEEGSQHVVQVYIPLSTDGMGTDEDWHWLEQLEDRLSDRLSDEQVGELDGNEIGEGEWRLYLYGPNADALAATVLAVLKDWPVPAGSYVLKRYGDLDARTERIDL